MYLSGIDHNGLVALYEVHIRPLPQRQAPKRAHSERLKSGEELPAALAEGGAATGEGVEEGERDGLDFLAGMLSDWQQPYRTQQTENNGKDRGAGSVLVVDGTHSESF